MISISITPIGIVACIVIIGAMARYAVREDRNPIVWAVITFGCLLATLIIPWSTWLTIPLGGLIALSIFALYDFNARTAKR